VRPYSVDLAVDYVAAQAERPTRPWANRCLRLVVEAYGWLEARHADAGAWWTWLPDELRRDTPEPGLIAAWPGTPGHVALVLDGGLCASTDVRGPGTVAVVPLDELTEWLAASPAGYGAPVFRGARGVRMIEWPSMTARRRET
jgi:hypothetical protein